MGFLLGVYWLAGSRSPSGSGESHHFTETKTQIPAACQPQPRKTHIIKLISQLQKPTRKISDTWIIDTGKRETRYRLVKIHQTIRQPHTMWQYAWSETRKLTWVLSIFFFCKLIYFNWRLITLQYCSGFCHKFTRISHGGTCVPHPEPLPPSTLWEKVRVGWFERIAMKHVCYHMWDRSPVQVGVLGIFIGSWPHRQNWPSVWPTLTSICPRVQVGTYSERCQIHGLQRREFYFGTKDLTSVIQSFLCQSFKTVKKAKRKLLT